MRKVIMLGFASLLSAADLSQAIEIPDAKAILIKDALPTPKEYKMPSGCISSDPKSIARGEFIFHFLNTKEAKKTPPEGIAKTLANGKEKQLGNCVACHNIEGAIGYGNIGPDLTNYKEYFYDSGVRDAQFIYQKIAEPRTDNPASAMTVNLANGLMSESEVCDLVSYIVAPK